MLLQRPLKFQEKQKQSFPDVANLDRKNPDCFCRLMTSCANNGAQWKEAGKMDPMHLHYIWLIFSILFYCEELMIVAGAECACDQ